MWCVGVDRVNFDEVVSVVANDILCVLQKEKIKGIKVRQARWPSCMPVPANLLGNLGFKKSVISLWECEYAVFCWDSMSLGSIFSKIGVMKASNIYRYTIPLVQSAMKRCLNILFGHSRKHVQHLTVSRMLIKVVVPQSSEVLSNNISDTWTVASPQKNILVIKSF
jgi:hypothetical protein